MSPIFISPAQASVLGIPAAFFSVLIPVVGITAFIVILAKRCAPLVRSQADSRFDNPVGRLIHMIKYALFQYRHPRYMTAGVIHILLFAGFLTLALRSITLVFTGITDDFILPGLGGATGHFYDAAKDIAATLVAVAVITAAVRRLFFKPDRYNVPAKAKVADHSKEAVFVLFLIFSLVSCDMIFEASHDAFLMKNGLAAASMVPGTGRWLAAGLLTGSSVNMLQSLHLVSYFLHDLVFFFFLCFLPMGKHFHVITSFPNIFLGKRKKGTIKPVRWGVSDEKLDDLESFGVKQFEDFTWKHMLDFYSCVDCGRCSDNCPANAVGRPLSPRFISIKNRDFAFRHYPVKGPIQPSKENLIGSILTEDEIWSCTTCGACEQECPVLIEYIDKIVDLRRGMVDDGNVPQSLQKPLAALEKRGNPWGKMEKKRAAWAQDKDFADKVTVEVLDKKGRADCLYFVDSISSFDDRMIGIAQATAQILTAAGQDYGILGRTEKDSGNEVRRFGEEMLFQTLRDHNTEAIRQTGASRIITSDPHAYNCLTNEYQELPPVYHISQTILEFLESDRLTLQSASGNGKVYTYHDPCYLGRHNGLYDPPRQVLDAIAGLHRVEMERCRDRSFCCGGGGLMLFYEPEEEQRMGVVRVEMAAAAGANVIVTACPFCLVNMEDAIKVAGLEGKMEAIDFCELVARHLPEQAPKVTG